MHPRQISIKSWWRSCIIVMLMKITSPPQKYKSNFPVAFRSAESFNLVRLYKWRKCASHPQTAFLATTSTALLQLIALPLQHSVKINAFFFFYCFFGLGARVYARWQAFVQSTVQSISARANWSRAVVGLHASRRWGVGRRESFSRASFTSSLTTAHPRQPRTMP